MIHFNSKPSQLTYPRFSPKISGQKNKSRDRKLAKSRYFAYFGFGYCYLGAVGLAVYPLLLLSIRKIILNWKDLVVIMLFTFYLAIKLGNSEDYGTYNLINTTRVYLGFLGFYIYFKSLGNQQSLSIKNILLFLSLTTIIEAILINTFVSIEVMPNYPDHLQSTGAFFGFYQRPYGFAATPSSTSSLLVTMLSLTGEVKTKNWKEKILNFIPLLAVIVCVSGTGYLLLLCWLIISNKHFNLSKSFQNSKILIFIWCGLLVSLAYVVVNLYSQIQINIDANNVLSKVSPEYILFLLSLKFSDQLEIYNLFNLDLSQIIFGKSLPAGELPILGGDFGWLLFVYFSGVFGSLIMLLTIIANMNIRNYKPLFIMVLSTFHYPTIFTVPGQILFAYILTRKPQLNSSYDMRHL